ncbi:MAG: DUF2306 domain-containing protein [Pseudomonadota bacterium]
MMRLIGHALLTCFLLLLALATLEFVSHANSLGWSGLGGGARDSRLISPHQVANFGIFLHMVTGAVITVLAPLQLVPILRRKWPVVHRWSGRVLVVFAFVTGCGGLAYIALHGTIGGPRMSVAFAIYGFLVLICALQTIRFARTRNWVAHQDWALRMFFLAIGSWLYRVHYAIWAPLTDRAGMARDFSGSFDQFNLWAFYVPYLVLLECVLAAKARGIFRSSQRSITL